MATWTSGGRSISALTAAGWFSFSVPVGAAGVVVGLNRTDLSADPGEIEFAMMFGAGSCRVLESGANKTALASYASADVFHIVRTGTGAVYYCVGSTPVSIPGLPFDLPGTLIYKSDASCIGDAYLDASLLMLGDRVDDASITPLTASSPDGSAALQFEPLVLASSEGSNEGASLAFRPLVVSANGEDPSGAALSFAPMVFAASEGSNEGAALSFTQLAVSGIEGMAVMLEGAELTMQPLTLYAVGSGVEVAGADMALPKMAARGSEGDLAEAVLSLGPMTMFGLELPVAVPAFFVTLPSVGNWEQTPDIEEIGTGLDTLADYSSTLVQEVGAGVDLLSLQVKSSNTVQETGEGLDILRHGVTIAVQEVGEGFDEQVAAAAYSLLEVGAGLEFVAQSGAGQDDVQEVGTGRDWVTPMFGADVFEVGNGFDFVASSAAVSVQEIGAGLEFIASSGALSDVVQEMATGVDYLAMQVASSNTVQEVGAGHDSLLMHNPNLVAWVMNTETGGVAWYENWSFTGMCVVGGKVLAIGPEGLAVVGGNTDAGAHINARVAFGFTDFSGYADSGTPKNSDPQRKRVESYWFGYHSTGVLNAAVETFGQSTYTYTMAPRPANSPRNNRIVPGKGLNARFWRITLANTAGCAFEVNSMAADIARSSRRL